MSPTLEVSNVSVALGGLPVLNGITLHVNQGEIVGIIGPNGAGKTTLFNAIAGDLRPETGEVKLNGAQVGHWPPERLARAGLVRTFQVPRLFEDLSVIENCMVAAKAQRGESLLALWVDPGGIRHQEAEIEARAWEVLDLVEMTHVANERAGALSGGQRKLLEFARCLMTRPDVMLLDEPVAGVSPVLMASIGDLIRLLQRDGLTLLIIEHRMSFLMATCDRIVAIAAGSTIAEGLPQAVRDNPAVIEAYLGDE